MHTATFFGKLTSVVEAAECETKTFVVFWSALDRLRYDFSYFARLGLVWYGMDAVVHYQRVAIYNRRGNEWCDNIAVSRTDGVSFIEAISE